MNIQKIYKGEDIKKLFISFQQVDTKRNRTKEGTGLGLSIVKKTLMMLSYDIKVMNVKNGVKFIIK